MKDEDNKQPFASNIASTVASLIVMMVITVSVVLPIFATLVQDVDPQLSGLISVIPVLLIVGIVLFVVRQFSKSDR